MALQIVSEINLAGTAFSDVDSARTQLYNDVPQAVEDLVQSMKNDGKIIDDSFTLTSSGGIHHSRTFVDEAAYTEYITNQSYIDAKSEITSIGWSATVVERNQLA